MTPISHGVWPSRAGQGVSNASREAGTRHTFFAVSKDDMCGRIPRCFLGAQYSQGRVRMCGFSKREDFKYTMRQSGDGIVGVAWYDFH